MGQVLIPVAGAAFGFMIGGPAGAQAGWMLGSLGSALMAPSQPKPAVGSLAPTEVEYGWSIPRIRGTRRVTGWRLHQSTLEPVAQRVETKGSSSRTVGYRYRCNFGILICRRGVTATVRIWRNKELVSVFRTDADWEDIAASIAGTHWQSATFYKGEADQLPHPQYEEDKSPKLVPAYRGWCTLWFDGAWCDGRTPPGIEVEVTSGPEETVGLAAWTLTVPDFGSSFVSAPGSMGYLSPGVVPIKMPGVYSFGDSGYGGSSHWSTKEEAIARGMALAPGAIESTGETLIDVDDAPTLLSVTAVGGTLTENYIVNGIVQAGGDPFVDSYSFVVSYRNQVYDFDVIPALTGQYSAQQFGFDSSATSPDIYRGSSDVPAVCVVGGTNAMLGIVGGAATLYSHPSWVNGRYVIRDGVLWLAPAEAAGPFVRRYPIGVGTATAASDPVIGEGSATSGLACDGDTVFFNIAGTIHQYDATTMASSGANFSSPGNHIFCNSAGDLYCFAGDEKLYLRTGGTWVEVLDVSGGLFDASQLFHPPTYEGGLLHAIQPAAATSGYTAWQGIVSLPTITPTGTTVNAILSNYWQACGVPASQIDLSETAGLTVDGYTAQGTGKHVTDELSTSHFFDVINNGIGLKTIMRGSASVGDIPWAHTGVGVNDPAAEPQEADPRSPVETPRRISVSGANGDADHEVSTQTDDRIIGQNTQQDSFSFAITATPEKLKGIANTIAADRKTAANALHFQVGTRWLDLELGDVTTVHGAHGETRRVRLIRESFADWVRTFDSVHDRAADIQLVGVVTEAGANEPTLTITVPGTAEVLVVDGPLLRDQDNSPGVVLGVDLIGGAGFAGVYNSSSQNGAFESVAQIEDEARVGTLLTSLRSWNGKYQWDQYGTFDVLMADGATLTASTKSAMSADRTLNWALIGSETRGWELIRYLDPELIAENTYRITTTLRARAGTETLSYVHLPGDRFLVVDTTLRSVILNSATAGTDQWWKAVAAGRNVTTTAARSAPFNAVRTKPLSPSFMRAERDASGNMTVRWSPRTRFATRWHGAVRPNSELIESYRVEFFLAGVFGAPVRSLVVSAREAPYTALQQSSDGVINQARIAVRVRAIGPTGQLGYPLEEVV